MKLELIEIEPLVRYRTSRSSGPGGQAVNKIETRVEAIINIYELDLSQEQGLRLLEKLSSRINSNGEMIVASSDSRSQVQNKRSALNRMLELLNDALHIPAPRKKTKPSRSAIKQRLDAKSRHSEVKQRRRWKPD